MVTKNIESYGSKLLTRLFLLAFVVLVGVSPLVYADVTTEQQQEWKTKLEKLIRLANEDPQSLFAGALSPQKYEARRQQLTEQAKEIRELVKDNDALKQLAARAHFAIQKAYKAVAPQLQQLSKEDVTKFKDFINLARQEPTAIFTDPAQREVLKEKLLNKLNQLRNGATQEHKQLISDVERAIGRAYQAAGAVRKDLSSEDREKLGKFESLSAEEIFPLEVLTTANKKQLELLDERNAKLKDMLNELEKNATSSEAKALIQRAKAALVKAFDKRKEQLSSSVKEEISQSVTPIVAAVLEVLTSDNDAPPMETPFEAPPLEPITTQAPTSAPSTTSSQAEKPTRARSFGGRDDLLADIRKGRQLRPVTVKSPQPKSPKVEQALSPQEKLRRDIAEQMRLRRPAIENED